MSLGCAARLLGGELLGADRSFLGVATDTRQPLGETLFVALLGERHDAHDFVDQARRAGAAAALVSRPVPCALPQLLVADTRAALGSLAALWRERFRLPLVAVTGSNGKTTVKEMMSAILGRMASTLTTRGNLNNDIGLPLTLLRLETGHCYAVVEMGANHPGEIARLSALARPTVALITNAGPAHLEGFGSLAGVAQAKGEIFSGLVPDGVAVINADDPYASLWRRLAASREILDFGIEQPAQVRARIVSEAEEPGLRFELVTPVGGCEVTVPLPGRHNVMNALAASAGALAAGADLVAIESGLRKVAGVARRLQSRSARHGARLLDDTYNANPASVEVALAVLAASPGRRTLVLGDMAEMGPEAARFHAQVGETARRMGIDGLWATGELSRAAVNAFGSGARHFPDIETLVAALTDELHPELTLLVKGSRRAGMERVVEALVIEEGGRGSGAGAAGRATGEPSRAAAEA